MLQMKESGAENHAAIVARIFSGDSAAEEDLIRDFSPRVYALLVARTRDREVSRDLLQDVLIAVLRSLRNGSLRDAERLPAFIHGIARNICNNHFRGVARAPRLEELTADSATSGSECIHQANERQELVRRALQTLDVRDRGIVLMTLVEGLKPGDIAARLGLTSEVVRQRKSRAVKKITEFLRQLSRSSSNDHIESGD